jgi:hypothetical protein
LHVPQARRFNAGVPYSLRHLANESSQNGMGAYSWGYSVPYSSKTISKIRSTKTGTQLINKIFDIARAFSVSVTAELGRLPKGHFIAIIPCAKDLHGALNALVGKPRYETFEISNLGTFKNGTGGENWKIEKAVFSQSGQGTGPAISFNVVSVAGGPLTICATWLEGAIEETLVNLVCRDITHILNGLSQGLVAYSEIQYPSDVGTG